MDKQYVMHIILPPQRESVRYSERETAEMCHLTPGTLRHLHGQGLIQGEEIEGELRYCEEDILQLRQIRRLQHDLGINLAGIEVILHLLTRLEDLHRQLEQERQGTRERDQI